MIYFRHRDLIQIIIHFFTAELMWNHADLYYASFSSHGVRIPFIKNRKYLNREKIYVIISKYVHTVCKRLSGNFMLLSLECQLRHEGTFDFNYDKHVQWIFIFLHAVRWPVICMYLGGGQCIHFQSVWEKL